MSELPDIASVAERLLGPPNKRLSRGDKLRFGSKGSLAIDARDGCWFDHEAGKGGGVVELVEHVMRCDWREARRYLKAAELPKAPERPSRPKPEPQRVDFGPWERSLPIPGTPAAEYLFKRGLTAIDGLEHALRFCPAKRSMLALATDAVTGLPIGFQITPIRLDRTRGDRAWPFGTRARGAVCRIAPDERIEAEVAVCEGVEDALAIRQREPWRPIWATFGTANLNGFPVLPGVEVIHIFADADEGGRKAACALARRWHEAGRHVVAIAPAQSKDFGGMAA